MDSVSLGPQAEDVSFGRFEDGGPTWGFFAEPTPGTSNGAWIHLWIGNIDCDEQLGISDAVCLLLYMFGEPAAQCATFCCAASGDTNGDGSIALDDAIGLLVFLFLGGEMVMPNGVSSAEGPVGCSAYPQAEVGLPCETPCRP